MRRVIVICLGFIRIEISITPEEVLVGERLVPKSISFCRITGGVCVYLL